MREVELSYIAKFVCVTTSGRSRRFARQIEQQPMRTTTAKTMLKILVAIILSAPFLISASGEQLDKWEAADRETLRLPPSDFSKKRGKRSRRTGMHDSSGILPQLPAAQCNQRALQAFRSG